MRVVDDDENTEKVGVDYDESENLCEVDDDGNDENTEKTENCLNHDENAEKVGVRKVNGHLTHDDNDDDEWGKLCRFDFEFIMDLDECFKHVSSSIRARVAEIEPIKDLNSCPGFGWSVCSGTGPSGGQMVAVEIESGFQNAVQFSVILLYTNERVKQRGCYMYLFFSVKFSLTCVKAILRLKVNPVLFFLVKFSLSIVVLVNEHIGHSGQVRKLNIYGGKCTKLVYYYTGCHMGIIEKSKSIRNNVYLNYHCLFVLFDT